MFQRFVADARDTASLAQEIARRVASPTIEAEHILLALAEGRDAATQAILADAGLDPEGVREALERENERSLAAVGVSPHAFDLPPPARLVKSPRWAASAKLALERSLKVASARDDRRIEPSHILLGVLEAPVGTVPRALEGAGIDRAGLARRAEAAMDLAGHDGVSG